MFVPSPVLAPRGMGTWSARKPFSSSSRLPPLVAMGTVNFIITPWMGNKPKFWICGQSGGRCQYTQQQLGGGGRGSRGDPPSQAPSSPLAFSL